MDFNADGHMDFIAATYEGTVFLVAGGDSGWAEPKHLKDSKGRNIVISLYYDTEENDYKNADRSPEGQKDSGDHCVSATAFDWDNDGDLDLLLGAYDGPLYLQMNEGKAGAPAYTGINHPVLAGGKPFKMKGGLTAARLADWNGDGLQDLVCGGFKGGVSVCINTGKLGAPSFATPVTLVAKDKGGSGPVEGLYADPVDYDGDGDLDLLVGGYSVEPARETPLTEEETRALEALELEMEGLQDRMDDLYAQFEEDNDSLDKKAMRKAAREFGRSPAVKDLLGQIKKVGKAIADINPRPKRQSGVWLYRRKG